MKLKPIVVNFLLLTASVLMSVVLCEVVIRVLYKDQINLFPRYHTDAQYGEFHIRRIISDLDFTHRSIDGNFRFRTNNRGFRNDRDISYQKDPNEIRVFTVGDSHTQGLEVNQEETFTYVSEKILISQGLSAEVFNTGVSGYSTAEVLVLVENELIKYDPDFIVLGFFENDLIDNVKCGIYQLEDSDLRLVKTSHLPGVNIQNKIYKYELFHFLGENSYLYAFVFNSVWHYYKQRLKQTKRKVITTEYAIRTEEVDKYQIDLASKLIERLYKVCSQNNIKLLVMDIPTISGKSSIPNQMVQAVRKNSDTLYYYQDLKTEFSSLEQIHVPHGNRHINAEAHALIGRKIADYVLSTLDGNQIIQNPNP